MRGEAELAPDQADPAEAQERRLDRLGVGLRPFHDHRRELQDRLRELAGGEFGLGQVHAGVARSRAVGEFVDHAAECGLGLGLLAGVVQGPAVIDEHGVEGGAVPGRFLEISPKILARFRRLSPRGHEAGAGEQCAHGAARFRVFFQDNAERGESLVGLVGGLQRSALHERGVGGERVVGGNV